MYRQSEKNLLNSNISPICPYNMVNFCPLTAEIGLPVWSTPANFNRFRVLAALLHGILVMGVRQNFAALNRKRHLYSAGRPSRWAFAHILVPNLSHLLSCPLRYNNDTTILWDINPFYPFGRLGYNPDCTRHLHSFYI